MSFETVLLYIVFTAFLTGATMMLSLYMFIKRNMPEFALATFFFLSVTVHYIDKLHRLAIYS